MFSSKKDIDRHVKTSLNKLPENERYLRGLVIARQYFKLNEYASAEHWLSCYLSVQEDSAPAHKLLGQCYEKQRKYDRAVTSYQRSLQLDSKQTGLITDVCKLLLADDNLSKNLAKAKHWCDLAESERINHEAVLNLKLKVANKDTNGSDQPLVKDIILREIIARPLEPALRVRLVDHFLEERKLDEAFKYCFDLEMKFSETFLQSTEWTNGVAKMLSKYTESATGGGVAPKNWHYYLLQAIVLDRQIYLNLLADSTMESIKRSNMKEIAHRLYDLDQTLRQVADKGRNAAPQTQLADEYLRHYRGQLLLYSASLLFKGAQDAAAGSGSVRARDTTRKCLALLLLAYQCGVPSPDEVWLKQSSEVARQVMAFWNKQAAFRCCQAGATVLSCVDESMDASVLAQIQSVTESKVWTTVDDLMNQIRQLCSDAGWRKTVFRSLHPSGDSGSKASAASYFVQNGTAFGEPQYVLPKREELDLYLELAQSLFPSSLPYLVYLGLAMGTENLADLRCRAFPRLNFSTNNLDNCNLETLNQLDMDSFLYCSILVARSNLDSERHHQQHRLGTGTERPGFLPAANLIPLLCEENKIDWWCTAYHLIRSSTAKDAALSVAEQKQLLLHGLQAVRGTGAPLSDAIVLLHLGQILAKRAIGSGSLLAPEERRHVEGRAEAVYRAGVLLWKIRSESSAPPASTMFFRYGFESYECHQETVKLAETAVTFLAGTYFKHGRHLEFTQDFAGIALPFAAYFRAEAFKKLDESNHTPLKVKKMYAERARECIRQTQQYLGLPYVDRNHPLNHVVQSEMKRLCFANDSLDGTLNTSANGAGAGDESDHFQSFTSAVTVAGNGSSVIRSERETVTAVATAAATACLSKTNELESLIRQMMETLTFVKEDVLSIRNDMGDMQDRLVKIEENIYRKPTEAGASKVGGGGAGTVTGGDDPATVSATAAAAAAALQAMNEMYLMDELQNSAAAAAVYHHQVQAAAGRTAGMGLSPQPALPYAALYGAAAYPAYLAQQTPPSHQVQSQHQQSPAQQQQLLTSRGPLGVPVGASPLHGYQQPEQLLAAANSQAAAVASAYHSIPQNYPQPPLVVPPVMPPVGVAQTSTPNASLQKGPGGTGGAGGLSIEQSLQTPSLLTSWNSAYNGAPATFTNPSVPGPITPPATVSSHHAHHAPAEKGGAPVNVVITSSDPLPPRGPPAHSSSFAAGGSVTQPTYSVTIPPQHIKHSATGGSIGQGTTAASTAKLEAISPPIAKPLAANVAAANNNTSSPSFFAQAVSSSPTVKSLLAGGGSVNAGANNDDDDDDVKNISGSVEYDPRPDFQPIIPLPDEIVVRTGEEDEEQIFTGRSKLLRLVDREWKERGLGELKILRSKTDLAKYRIVMRREQIHKICANHYITPELIIKPMEKRKECYIWAAMDFADEEPRKESFCARFGTAELAKQFYDAFVAARDEVARLRASDPGAAGGPPAAAQPPPATVPTSFAFSAPKTAGTVGKATTPTTVAAATAKKDPVAPFGEFTFAKNYTPPTVVTGTKGTGVSEPAAAQGGASKPSPFASFTFKAQTTGASTVEGISFGIGGTAGGGVGAASSKPPASGFGDAFKPKSGTWDCSGCYVNNKADATHCLACNGPRDPSKPDEGSAGKPKGGLFDNLATAGGGSKFTFGMPQPVGTPPAPITFGVAPGAVTKKPPVELDSVKTTTAAAATGFGDKFKPKPGAWTCGGCYLSNGADVLYCASCESPKDDTVPKKSASGGNVGGLLKAADTMPKFNFTAGGGFTFGVPATTGTSSVPSSTTTSSAQPAPPVFGSTAGSEGFMFGAGASPLKPPRGSQSSSEPVAKPVFKFELPTPAGGLSFGSKLIAPTATDKAPTVTGVETINPASKVEPPEKATFGFVFKPKSPGRTLSTSSGGGGAAEGADDDGTGGAGGDSSITEEENNTYFAPVIALPDKVDVKTGEEDEDVLYSHRAKLYRFVSSEWKERGIGDVKILKHKTTGKLRMIMRREQVLKICLNHALTEDVCYSKKDEKSWQFVANDFSEGTFELMNFCLRFKSVDIAQEFRDAITDALSGKLTPSGGKASPGTVAVPAEPRDSTINTTTSPSGDFNFSKLSDISLNERETLEKLKLPSNFLDAPAVACSGCRGCDVEAFTFPVVDGSKLTNESPDDSPLPIDIRNVAPLPSQHSTPKKAVSFGTAPVPGVGNLFGSLTFGVPPASTGGVTGGPQLTASTKTSSFLAAEQKVSGTMKPSLTPFLAPNTIFGGGQPAAAGAAPATGEPTSQAGGGNKLIFGSSQSGVGSASGGSGGSIFSASLNTTPKTSFVPALPSSTGVAAPTETSSTTTEEDKSASDVGATTNTPTPLIQQASLSTTSPADAGGKLFGAISFGGGTTTPAPFGSIGTKSIFGGTTTTAPSTATAPSNLFGSVVFGGSSDSTPKSIFGGSVGAAPNAFSFGGPAKLPEGKVASTLITPTAKDAPPVLTMDGGVSFADLASSSPSGFGSFKKFDDAKTGSAGFVGLTVKEDFFSRSAASKLNSSADGTRSNGNADAGGTGAGGGGGETAGDENYDPYYAPVIQLPDEIEVRTGEEEETKLFGDRAKLYRYDSDTKEWKERGVGELKILHHPVRNTYRLLLRREQIYKLVLNHAIGADLAVTPMNNSGKAFVWGALNHADGPPQLEKLAVRFKNETIADEFRRMLESCQEKLRSRPDLEPDQD
ncbi:E3 SUMO-protein ligase RanBP2 [Anopheles bellator]|uniref:E3 SUMO-protein ligase RanBP2 n=1 Tax=Anopheles bellator TaxID=139047 RepID=UPI002649F0E8|nr:E3 SUMO-protein ligase RanBP2 [Anopheles bellator]